MAETKSHRVSVTITLIAIAIIYPYMKKNIYIFGAGYVGLSNAVLLAKNNRVTLIDINKHRIDSIRKKNSPIKDEEIQNYLSGYPLDLTAETEIDDRIRDADFAVIATPTNYNESTSTFDTSSIESVLEELQKAAFEGTVVIRSTVPMGYTDKLYKNGWEKLLFVPEFLREGKALYDNLNPSRIVVGNSESEMGKVSAKTFATLLAEAADRDQVPTLFMGFAEAESAKLFSNTYLALRVAFFNELDSYAFSRGLNTKKIIEAVCQDPRIGMHYNNPSFGYGGYCLPKDTKQLLSSFSNVPQSMISAVVRSNKVRKQFIAEEVFKKGVKTVGVYRLVMKKNSDNFRESAVFDVIELLKKQGIQIIVYEPLVEEKFFLNNEVINDIVEFGERSDLILMNRFDKLVELPKEKIFTRDIFGEY